MTEETGRVEKLTVYIDGMSYGNGFYRWGRPASLVEKDNEGEEMTEQSKDGIGVDPTALMNNLLEGQFYSGLNALLEEYEVQKNTQSGK